MSLVDEITEWCATPTNPLFLHFDVDCVLVEDDPYATYDSINCHRAVFLRKSIVSENPVTFSDEFVAVEYEFDVEAQAYSIDGVYEVAPVEIKKIKYVRKN